MLKKTCNAQEYCFSFINKSFYQNIHAPLLFQEDPHKWWKLSAPSLIDGEAKLKLDPFLDYVENLVDYCQSVENETNVFAKLSISIVFLSANGFLITKPKHWRLATTNPKTTNMQETIQHQIKPDISW